MENNPYFREISLDHAAVAQLPENGELPGLSAVTLSDDESGTNLFMNKLKSMIVNN